MPPLDIYLYLFQVPLNYRHPCRRQWGAGTGILHKVTRCFAIFPVYKPLDLEFEALLCGVTDYWCAYSYILCITPFVVINAAGVMIAERAAIFLDFCHLVQFGFCLRYC